ncbi:MAG: hypothetical protein EP307_14165 [Rhodobacteraceae bacterium]|nr:MAG: hypothetical protein EP307_14165 [Paracoccaceae bacterium]
MKYKNFRALALSTSALVMVVAQAVRAEPVPADGEMTPPVLSTQGTPGLEWDAGATLSFQHSDNIYLTSNDRVSDWAAILSPWLRMTLRQQDFRLDLTASADIARYSGNSNEDYEDLFLGAQLRYRFSDRLFAFGGLDFAQDHESRLSPDDVNGISPTEYTESSAFLGIGGQLETGSYRIGLNVRDLDYDDTPAAGGAIIDNDDRDRRQTELGARFGVFQMEDGEVFVQVIYDERDYDQPIDNEGFQRSSKGYEATIGYSGTVGRFRGEAFMGIMSRDYDDARFASITTLDMGVDMTANLGRGTSLDAILERSIEETTLAGASAYISTTAGLRLRHRVTPDLSIAAYAFLTENDYRGVARTDSVSEIGVSLRHYLNPRVYIDADYDYRQRLSDVAGAEFDDHRITLTLGTSLREQYDATSATLARPGASGFYLGAFLGDNALQTRVEGFRGVNPAGLIADFGDHGGAAGVFAGYRWDYGSLVLGVEAEYEANDTSWPHLANRTFSVERGDAWSLSALAGLRVRGGNLVYSRFGVISSEFNSSYQDGVGPLVQLSDRETGFLVGVGAEVPFGRGLSGRIEYQLRAYGDYEIGAPLGGGNDDNFANIESVVRFGLVYELGGGQPVEAAEPTEFGGFYAGGYIGHGTLQSDNVGPRPGGAGGAPFVLSTVRAGQGFSGGVLAGWGHQANRLYVGGEAEFEVSDASWNIKRDSNNGRIYSFKKIHSVGAGLRLGYVVNDNVLLFARAGLVRTRIDVNYVDGPNPPFASSPDLDGVRFGGGIEFAISDDMHARFEYTQTNYEGNSVNYGTGTDDFDTTERQFRIGLVKQF